jgi:hypothetical protein
MVINKDWADSHETTITIENLAGSPTIVDVHTFNCNSGITNPLDAQNDYGYRHTYGYDRVRSTVETSVSHDYANGTDTVTHTFPAHSVSVIEFTITGITAVDSISDAIEAYGGAPVNLTGIVTATFDGDRFYIEHQDRIAGIGVKYTGTPAVGDQVTVTGIVMTDGGERIIGNADITDDDPTTALNALGMRNEWVGGASPSQFVPTIVDGFGFYNVGLLVQSWGRVSEISGSDFFYIRDNITTKLTRVIFPAGVTKPSANTYVRVTGISSVWCNWASDYLPAIRVRQQSDIEPLTQTFSDNEIQLLARL